MSKSGSTFSKAIQARQWNLALRFALRELRSGLQGFRIFLICIILGVTAIATIGTLSDNIEGGLKDEGQKILGGDIELRLVHQRIKDNQLNWLENRAKVIEVVTLRAMAITQPSSQSSNNETGNARTLVEVKAIDNIYPLFGQLELDGIIDNEDALKRKGAHYGLAADQDMLTRLGAKIGDHIKLGELIFELRAKINNEPDRLSGGFFFGPRVIISKQALRETNLIQPGSLIYWHYKLDIDGNAQDAAMKRVKQSISEQFPEAGWRIRTRDRAAPGIQQFVSRMTFFLTLVGLTSLIVGGVGISNAVQNFMQSRQRNIAMLKCLGASSTLIFNIYFIQIMLIAAIGVIAGLVLGAIIPPLLNSALRDIIPVPISSGIALKPLTIAACFGFLITGIFALLPLARAKQRRARDIFMAQIQPDTEQPSLISLASIGALVFLAFVLAINAFSNTTLILFYTGGLIASFIILQLMARLIMSLTSQLPRPKITELRLALVNLYRPGAPTPAIVVSLGIGLSLFVTLAMLDSNMTRELRQNIPDKAPSFFFLDIQRDKIDQFTNTLTTNEGVEDFTAVPLIRGQIKSVNDVAASKLKTTSNAAWALRGDRGLTYSEEIPEGSTLVQGDWWAQDYNGEPLVSISNDIAQGLGLKIGDKMTVSVLGRDVTAKIASFRQIEWRSLGINFVLVFSPNTLRGAPHSNLVSVIMNDETKEETLVQKISNQYPTVSIVRVKETLASVNSLLSKLLLTIRGSNIITLVIGTLVLAGAMASGLQMRIYDAVILKTLGATHKQLLRAFALEYSLLGIITAFFALMTGSIASWAIITYIMDFGWKFDVVTAVTTLICTGFLTVIAGLAVTQRALRAKIAPILRQI